MDTNPAGPAERAFEVLRAQVAGLAAEIASARTELRTAAARPVPDYDLTLGQIAKQLVALTARVAAVEGKPALGFTLGRFEDELGRIVSMHVASAMVPVRDVAQTVKQHAQELYDAGGGVVARGRWYRRIAGGAVFGLAVGIALCFGAVAAFPAGAGAWIATTVIGGSPWETGQVLMRRGSADMFGRMVRLYNACPHDVPTNLCEAAMMVAAATAPVEVEAPAPKPVLATPLVSGKKR